MAEKTKKYYLPEAEYDPTFLKALACAVHCDVLEPEELEYWFENEWTHLKMAKEMYKRVKK